MQRFIANAVMNIHTPDRVTPSSGGYGAGLKAEMRGSAVYAFAFYPHPVRVSNSIQIQNYSGELQNNYKQKEVILIEPYSKTLEEVITCQNYFDALKKCNKDVNYKFSVQNYDANCVPMITETVNEILSGKIPTVRHAVQVKIYERGKERTITPIDISDRITQKVLCDTVLIPAIYPHLIFDNGASVEGKGTEFARNRVNEFIEGAKRNYGAENLYVLVFDFKSYFDSIPHEQCYLTLNKYIKDQRLVDLTMGIIESYKLDEIYAIESRDERERRLKALYEHKDVGICLGSQISQIMAVAVPNGFDHYIKDVKHIKYYERYMDDGVIILNDKDRLLKLKDELYGVAESYGLTFNERKTYVVKASKGFTFLKVKYNITNDGKTVKRLTHQGIVRERRRLRKLKPKVDAGILTNDDIYNSMQSWNAHSEIAEDYKTTKEMCKTYDELYGGYKMTRKYYDEHPDETRGKKVTRH